MANRFILLIVTVLLSSCGVAQPVKEHGKLSVKGTQLVDKMANMLCYAALATAGTAFGRDFIMRVPLSG